MISDTNLTHLIKCDIKSSEDDLEEKQIKNHDVIQGIDDVSIENKHLSITKTKSLELLNSIFENDKCITRCLSEPKKIKRLNIKLHKT